MVSRFVLHTTNHPRGVPTMEKVISSVSIFHTVYNKYIRLSDRVAQCIEQYGGVA